MNIHEHQAKAVLKEFGVNVPRGFPAFTVDEAVKAAKALKGTKVFVVKSQIHAGGRGKGKFEGLPAAAKGGVRVVKSVDDVKQNAKEMLGRVLVTHQTGPKGRQVNRLYIEEGADIQRELYLSLLVDRETSRISVVASTEGGMDIEDVAHSTPEKIISFSIDPATGVFAHHGRHLSQALGLSGDLAKQASTLLSQLYAAFNAKDMEMLEINPLIVTGGGELKVLDAKVSFDGNALYRHPDIVALRDTTEEDAKEIEASKFDLSYIALDGEIAAEIFRHEPADEHEVFPPPAQSSPHGQERTFRQAGVPGIIVAVGLVFHGLQKPSHSRRAPAASGPRSPVDWRSR